MRKYAAILNSRQSLLPNGETEWIRKTKRAILWAGENDYALLTSVGMQTWETQVAFLSINKIRQRIIIPLRENERLDDVCARLTTEYDLNRESVEFAHVESINPMIDVRVQRDKAIIEQASLLLPVSIRSNGNLSRLINQATQKGQAIENRFHCEHNQPSSTQSYVIDLNELNPVITQDNRNYLIHWTRSSNRVWPDERAIDYYRDLLSSKSYPRTAFDTLSRILEIGKIVASSRHMPGDIATVSFSALSPQDVVPLMRWRQRYRQMSFEPYGIGVNIDAAKDAGIMPVCYYDKSEGVTDSTPNWLTQSSGIITDWRNEREYRSLSDFSLDRISSDKLIIFTRYKHEAEELMAKSGLRTVAITR